VTSSLLEGRVAIITDGTPLVLLAPAVFWCFLQSSEDYFQGYWFSSFIRIMRLITALISLTGPAVYVAVTTYHQEMLPTALLVSIASQREGVPFPAVVEALMLEFAFEILREGGIRLPRPVGQSVSIVGALIIGQAAVQAGLVSAAMVIVVALTGIASFTIPAFNIGVTFRLLRFPIIIAASILGFYGVMLALLFILTHMCSLRSFGVPYLSPVAPLHFGELKDVAIRIPWWSMLRRPKIFGSQDIVRQRSMRGKGK
jgi:spore germination protein KA/spore germination protein